MPITNSARGRGTSTGAANVARQRAMELEPVIIELKGIGLSLARIAGELNKRKVATPRGGRWDHSSVRNVLNRLAVRF